MCMMSRVTCFFLEHDGILVVCVYSCSSLSSDFYFIFVSQRLPTQCSGVTCPASSVTLLCLYVDILPPVILFKEFVHDIANHIHRTCATPSSHSPQPRRHTLTPSQRRIKVRDIMCSLWTKLRVAELLTHWR